MAQAAKQLMDRLQKAPHDAGELLYHLKHSGWPVRHVAHRAWSMHIVIDDQNQVVYITKIALMRA